MMGGQVQLPNAAKGADREQARAIRDAARRGRARQRRGRRGRHDRQIERALSQAELERREIAQIGRVTARSSARSATRARASKTCGDDLDGARSVRDAEPSPTRAARGPAGDRRALDRGCSTQPRRARSGLRAARGARPAALEARTPRPARRRRRRAAGRRTPARSASASARRTSSAAPALARETGRAEITELFVRADSRRRSGLGRALAEAAFAWARERGARARRGARRGRATTRGRRSGVALGFGDFVDVLASPAVGFAPFPDSPGVPPWPSRPIPSPSS